MKKFLWKVLLAGICIFAGQCVFWLIIIQQDIKIENIAEEVYEAIEIAETPNTYTEVIIGDSVCRQLLSHENQVENEVVCYMGTNQLITACGNYILLSRYIENNPQTEKVYYFVRPQSLGKDMDQHLFYPYFVIPFCRTEYMPYLEEETKISLTEKFGNMFVYNRYVKGLLLNNKALLSKYIEKYNESDITQHNLSMITIVYLKKMQELCKEHNIEFVVIATPVAGNSSDYDWKSYMNDVKKYGFEDLMSEYTDDIYYIPKEYFTDGIHLESGYVKENREEILKRIFGEFPVR